MRTCKRCVAEKEDEEFSLHASEKDGIRTWCKPCCSVSRKEYYKKNIQTEKPRAIAYYHWNADERKKYAESYRNKNLDLISKKSKQKRSENPQKFRDYVNSYRKNNREWLAILEKSPKRREKINRWVRNKRKKDPMFALKIALRSRLGAAFRGHGWKKNGHSEELLGASIKEVSSHIESQFVHGMSWENRGKWHIDHVVPIASARTPEELMVLCKYTNLQPLWAEDNRAKSSKLNWGKNER